MSLRATLCRMKGKKRFLLLMLVTLLLGMAFAAINPHAVSVEFAIGRLSMPLGLALVLACGIGMVAGVLMRAAWVAELLNERGRLRRALKAAEARARHQIVSREGQG